MTIQQWTSVLTLAVVGFTACAEFGLYAFVSEARFDDWVRS